MMHNSKFLSKGGKLLPPLLRKTTTIILYSILILHFIVIGFSQFPDNPLQHQYKVQLNHYMDPYFAQAWTLFAPNPVSTNMNLLVQFEYELNDKSTLSDWLDASDPLTKEHQISFWSPSQRVSKFLMSSMQIVNDNHNEFYKSVKVDTVLSKVDSLKIQKLYEKSMISNYGHCSLIQYSSFIAQKYFYEKKINPQKIFVRYKIFNSKFPRFSKRKIDYYDLKNYTYSQLTSLRSQLK
jgi:hypothetical protein